MKAFITGSTGFVGTHLVSLLQREPSVKKVICLVRSPSKARERLGSFGKVELLPGDLEHLPELPEDTDLLFHLAGVTKALARDDYERFNSLSLIPLLERASTLRNLKRFVLVSSLAAAGPSQPGRPLDEEAFPNPVSLYGRSKRSGELRALSYAEHLPLTILRPPSVYGEWDTDFPVTFRMLKRGLALNLVYGSSERRVSLISADVLSRAILHFAFLPLRSGEIFHLGEPREYLWNEVEEAVFRFFHVNRPFRLTLPKPLGYGAALFASLAERLSGQAKIFSLHKLPELLQPCWTSSWQKAAKTGFLTRDSFPERVQTLLAWYVQRGWL